jgi:hypothetical protein
MDIGTDLVHIASSSHLGYDSALRCTRIELPAVSVDVTESVRLERADTWMPRKLASTPAFSGNAQETLLPIKEYLLR